MTVKIGVVGPCAAGKSTLIAALRQHGIHARHIAQEHSYVPDMWRRITNPDLLIYLDISYPLTIQRRQLSWTREEYDEQISRLKHARVHADIYISTDLLTPQQVLEFVLKSLESL
jgi:deoxyadenosine/deoxycytidine kinase